jgi:hypothetical protein
MMHFIYGGTLDFPDKANVGYVLHFNKFRYKNVNILQNIIELLLNYFTKCQ